MKLDKIFIVRSRKYQHTLSHDKPSMSTNMRISSGIAIAGCVSFIWMATLIESGKILINYGAIIKRFNELKIENTSNALKYSAETYLYKSIH